MKTRFSTLDIIALLPELNERCKGLRVTNVYNINNKTYLLKLSKSTGDEKEEDEDKNKNFLLLESGMRLHLTEYDWPKETYPNGFTMKVRKHVKNKRIEYIRQLGYDRIIDIQFGINEAAYHIILELYDRGNILITDYNYMILNVFRPRKDGENEDVKFMVKEIYPVAHYKNVKGDRLERPEIRAIIDQAKVGDNLKKLFAPKLMYGPALLEHCFIECGLGENCKLDEQLSVDVEKIYKAIELAKSILESIVRQREGYIVQKEELNVLAKGESKIVSFLEFNPMRFAQYANLEKKQQTLVKYDSFNKAIDIYFSSIEAQKIDQRIYSKEKDAMKKLENIRRDHEKRLHDLEARQKDDNRKGYLIQINSELVEKALFILRSALARQMSWAEIKVMLKEAQEAGDLVASKICSLKFDVNAFTMLLDDPYEQVDTTATSPANGPTTAAAAKPTAMKVDISLEQSAYGNARKYFEERKFAKKKEDKTIEASSKALKNAQIKTAQALQEVQLKSTIVKSRKVLWFEKFFWFISSENFIVIAGRDAQQIEMIVKRYLKPNDLYVHADLHGASSVVIKNRNSKSRIPSKTIEEAACMAVCYSAAWDAKTPVRAWWVNADQVSKTAPSGEYLTIGSFIIRGKKNYLPQAPLAMGFSFFFRLDEESVANHVNDRKVKYVEMEDAQQAIDDANEVIENGEEENAFPDTKIRTTSKSDQHEQDMILEAMRPRPKVQRKLRNAKQEKKSADQAAANEQKQQQNKQSNPKNKKGKGKGKRNKKDDDWSDDEDKVTIKLNKKLQKDTRLQDLEEQTGAVSLDDDNTDEMANGDEANSHELTSDQEKEANQRESEQQEQDAQTTDAEAILEQQTQDGSSDSSEDERVDHGEEEEEAEEEAEEEEIETNDERREAEYLKLVNSLTGQPLSTDVLLYCVPVVAPYSAVMNCKYKVKVLPGTNKRGRAAKTALQVFLNDKRITPRERDLLKSMKDQDIARNLLSKVKITAQHLQQVKRKK